MWLYLASRKEKKRKDRFDNKAKEVNKNLKDKCEEHNLQLIQHHNINPFHHNKRFAFK